MERKRGYISIPESERASKKKKEREDEKRDEGARKFLKEISRGQDGKERNGGWNAEKDSAVTARTYVLGSRLQHQVSDRNGDNERRV